MFQCCQIEMHAVDEGIAGIVSLGERVPFKDIHVGGKQKLAVIVATPSIY